MKKLIFIFYFIFILSPAFACLPLGTVLAADTIDINTATLSQLDELTGIGPAKAQAIINARPFSLVDELDRVKGIGPKILQEIKSQGVACVNCATSVTTSASQADNKPPTPVPTQDPTPTIVYPTGIFINEILPIHYLMPL